MGLPVRGTMLPNGPVTVPLLVAARLVLDTTVAYDLLSSSTTPFASGVGATFTAEAGGVSCTQLTLVTTEGSKV